MEFQEPDEWPGNQWPRFLEILRAFCLSDAEQDKYFPVFHQPHYHSAMGGDGDTLCSYYPPLADGYDLCGAFLVRCEKAQDEMFERLATLFHEAAHKIEDPIESRTDVAALKKIRPALRALCSEALDFFGAENRAPQMKWQDIAPQ